MEQLIKPAGSRNGLRVVITGAECTGKTTLAESLAAHYNTEWIPEAARQFVDEEKREITSEDLFTISNLHLSSVQDAEAHDPPILILDTDLYSTIIYAEHYYGPCPKAIVKRAHQERGDLYVLCSPDIPWIPDPGQRDHPEVRNLLQARFVDLLTQEELHFISVSGNVIERMRLVIDRIRALRRKNAE